HRWGCRARSAQSRTAEVARRRDLSEGHARGALPPRRARPQPAAAPDGRPPGPHPPARGAARTAVPGSRRSGVRDGQLARASRGQGAGADAAEFRGEGMIQVQVSTPGGAYPIRIADGRLDALAQAVPANATAIALVSNPTVLAHHG